MQKNRKRLIGILGFLVLCIVIVGVNGCKKAEKEEIKIEDSLIGILVTTDKKEVENYYNNHRNEIENQKQHGNLNEDRIYLELETSTITNEDGEKEKEWNYIFPQLDGLYSFNVHILREQSEEEKYMNILSFGEGLYQINNSIQKNEKGEITKETLDATIFMNPEEMQNETNFYLYEIYQTPENQVYINCDMVEKMHLEAEGAFSGKTVSNGSDEILYNYSYNIHFERVTEATEIRIFQRNKENKVIKTNIYTSLNLPERMRTEKETESLIVEKYYKDRKKKEQIERKVYPYEEEEEIEIPIYINRGDGIYREEDIEIEWIR